jgi:cytoskeletal protein CcmA (bactofilin family)
MRQMAIRTILHLLAVAALLSIPALAEQNSDRFQISHNISVDPGQKSGDLVCVSCSIFIRGEVAGDVVAVHGNVVIEAGGQVAGSVTTVLGDVRIQGSTQVAGDIAVVGGALRRDPQATVAGSITDLEGTGWALLAVFLPLAVLGGFIALIVWLVSRTRRPAAVAA